MESKSNSIMKQEIVSVESASPAYQGQALGKKDIALIKEHIAKGASDAELKIFLAICQRTGLDPFSRQIHLVPRWDSKTGKEIRITQVGIDGFRVAAERSGAYAGSDDPTFGEEKELEVKDRNGKVEKTIKVPEWAKVTVYKIVQGVKCDFTSTVLFDEYYPGEKQGFMWRAKPHVMLAKCAEASALRKAFPMVLAGLYVPEELAAKNEDDNESQESPFDLAVKNLKKQENPRTLKTYLTKIKASEKYTDEEKVEIEKVVNDRIAEIEKK